MIRWVFLWLCLIAGPVLANEVPALYSVSGVAADDVLNIRIDPSASAPEVGAFSHDASDIEVVAVSDDGKWGLVNQGESSGWTSMRFLQAQAVDGTYPVSRTLSCFGTEPFWALDIRQDDAARYQSPIEPLLDMRAGRLVPARGFTDRYMIRLGGDWVAALRHGLCSDGMSDRSFGLQFDLIAGPDLMYSGCCSVAPAK